MADAPRAFVGHPTLALDFLGRDPMPSTRHQVHRKEPHSQFGARFVKDGPGARVDVMAAPTCVGPPLAHRMKLGPLVANRAMRLVAPVLDFHDPGEADRVIRKISLKLLEGVLSHGSNQYRSYCCARGMEGDFGGNIGASKRAAAN